jgi:hypothetical protein
MSLFISGIMEENPCLALSPASLSAEEYTLTVETCCFHQLTSTLQHALAGEKFFHEILKNNL